MASDCSPTQRTPSWATADRHTAAPSSSFELVRRGSSRPTQGTRRHDRGSPAGRGRAQPGMSGDRNTQTSYYARTELERQLQHEIQTRKEFLDHLIIEFERKNYQHVQALLDNTKQISNIMSDIQEAKKRRKRTRTWKDSKQWTMFLE